MEGMVLISRVFIENVVIKCKEDEFTLVHLRMVAGKYATSSLVDPMITLASCVSNLRIRL